MRLLQGYILPSLLTVLLHAAVLMFAADIWRKDEPRHTVKPQIISARLVKLEQTRAAAVQKQQATPVQQPAPKPVEVKKPEPKKQTPTPVKKPPETKPKVDPKKVQEERERVERERKHQQEQAREKQLAALMADEDQFLEAQSQEQLAMSHIGAIQQAIAAQWSRPPSARRDMEVVLLINLIPTGEVVSVRVLDSSGNTAFDRSAVNAVNKAERFPELAELPGRVFEQYFRELRLVFRPEDLRL